MESVVNANRQVLHENNNTFLSDVHTYHLYWDGENDDTESQRNNEIWKCLVTHIVL